MTKEQEESIENIKIYIHDWINESVDEDGYERYAIEEYDKEFMNDIETVLSMLKEKDRQIDLMSEEIEKGDIEFTEYCNFKIVCDRNCKECIVKYFERKATNNG